MSLPGSGTGVSGCARVAVVGGGIAGLAAAWELTGGHRADPASRVEVVVLEAGDRLGGKLRTENLDGWSVDVGPDGFVGRRPEAITLCAELGIGDRLVPVGVSGASVWARRRLRPLPAGLALGVPTRLRPLWRSGVLGPLGVLRVASDYLLPRPDARGPLGDRAVGPLVARKLGHQVVDTLADPLIGGIHAGTTADMSAAAVFPMLLEAAQQPGSFMRALRQLTDPGAPTVLNGGEARHGEAANRGDGEHGEDGEDGKTAPEERRPATPAFWTLGGGLETLAEALRIQLTARGVDVRTGTFVEVLRRSSEGHAPWVLRTSDGSIEVDGLVLAVPAPQAAALLRAAAQETSRLLGGFDHASVTVATLALPPEALPDTLYGTGVLVPASTRSVADLAQSREVAADTQGPVKVGRIRRPGRRRDADRFLVTALTFLSRKWPNLDRPHGTLLRASLGRFGDERVAELEDEAVVRRVLREIQVLLGIELQPRGWLVTRWPAAFPQYRVHHELRVGAIEAAVRRLPAVALAGASYHGIGIPACIADGRAAAAQVRAAVRRTPDARLT
jgi:protoporphyrinogen/coproporphyrinogen III oxidase